MSQGACLHVLYSPAAQVISGIVRRAGACVRPHQLLSIFLQQAPHCTSARAAASLASALLGACRCTPEDAEPLLGMWEQQMNGMADMSQV